MIEALIALVLIFWVLCAGAWITGFVVDAVGTVFAGLWEANRVTPRPRHLYPHEGDPAPVRREWWE